MSCDTPDNVNVSRLSPECMEAFEHHLGRIIDAVSDRDEIFGVMDDLNFMLRIVGSTRKSEDFLPIYQLCESRIERGEYDSLIWSLIRRGFSNEYIAEDIMKESRGHENPGKVYHRIHEIRRTARASKERLPVEMR